MRWTSLAALSLALVPGLGAAGGSHETVAVQSMLVRGEVDYELVVTPVAPAIAGFPDPYLGKCSVFKVVGTFGRLRNSFGVPPGVTRAGHMAAIARLDAARRAKKT